MIYCKKYARLRRVSQPQNPRSGCAPLLAVSSGKPEKMHQNDCDRAIDSIRRYCPAFAPKVALILGSGLGEFANHIQSATVVPYSDIPGFPRSSVPGHAGNLVIGRVGSTPVAALAGRAHLYEGWTSVQSTFPLRCLRRAGAEILIVSNASGGINPRFESGQVVLIDSHIDRMQRTPFMPNDLKEWESAEGLLVRSAELYDSELMSRAQNEALQLGYRLSCGTYLATLGPNYETRAEYRMFAKLGADMVGMSTVPETLLAKSLGMRILAFSIVTNVAKPDAPSKTEHSEVLEWSKKAQALLIPLVQRLL
jgi:purine-nucleoside phosphorylase